MNTTFKKVMDKAATLKREDPETRALYVQGIEDAKEEQAEAAERKEAAERIEDFNKAVDDETHAREREAFYRRQLDRLDFTPRMDEVEYYRERAAIVQEVESAAANFRKAAENALAMIIKAKRDYLTTAAEADVALDALDTASNFLQCKHRYKTVVYQDAPAQQIEDRNEWERHAIRYTNGSGRAYDLATLDGSERNYIICAAWRAAERVERSRREKEGRTGYYGN